MKRLNYDIHHAINFRSWRKGLANDFLTTFKFEQKKHEIVPVGTLRISHVPMNGFRPYSEHYGKRHSKYPHRLN